jgi:hypothetical protein
MGDPDDYFQLPIATRLTARALASRRSTQARIKVQLLRGGCLLYRLEARTRIADRTEIRPARVDDGRLGKEKSVVHQSGTGSQREREKPAT